MLHCFWVFVSDPVNQATLKWLFSGVAAAISGLWVVFLFWFQHRNKENPQSTSKIVWLTALTTVAILFIAAGWLYSEAEYLCPDCDVLNIDIKAPLNGAEMSTRSTIRGDATPNKVCRFVYVFVRDMASGTLVATDETQTLNRGVWSGILDLSHVPPKGEARVHVVLIDKPMYQIKVPLIQPTVSGAPSQPIQLWRQ